jgi:hypothetical protein
VPGLNIIRWPVKQAGEECQEAGEEEAEAGFAVGEIETGKGAVVFESGGIIGEGGVDLGREIAELELATIEEDISPPAFATVFICPVKGYAFIAG